MNFLKKLPIEYKGELHDIRLVNFTVDINEVKDQVPDGIKIRNFDGKAMISMVDVKLKKVNPTFLPAFFSFGYRHVAFRLLVDDSDLNNGTCKGIYFLKSFTNKLHIVLGGKILTNYNLEKAEVKERLDSMVLVQGEKKVVVQSDDKKIKGDRKMNELRSVIGAIDRAYSIIDGEVMVTQILREKWPIEPVECAFFENTFFKTAELQGVFKVNEVIYYKWLPSTSVNKTTAFKFPERNKRLSLEV